MSLEIKAPTDNRLLSLYLPHKRLCKVDKWYQQMYVIMIYRSINSIKRRKTAVNNSNVSNLLNYVLYK